MHKANELGPLIDYIGIGPIFSTTTKPNHNPPIAVDGLKHICSMAKHPSVAIGGINLNNAANVLKVTIKTSLKVYNHFRQVSTVWQSSLQSV